ncbi:hypothetical protein ACPCUV_04035 [Streptomyces platensis]
MPETSTAFVRPPGLLAALRQAGRSNAARYPLSATAKSLTELGHWIS